jgi:hypothetical protein
MMKFILVVAFCIVPALTQAVQTGGAGTVSQPVREECRLVQSEKQFEDITLVQQRELLEQVLSYTQCAERNAARDKKAALTPYLNADQYKRANSTWSQMAAQVSRLQHMLLRIDSQLLEGRTSPLEF